MGVLPQTPLDWVLLAVATATSVIPIAIYVVSARREERQLEERFGDAYRTYKLSTGMPIPPLYRLVSGRIQP